VDAEYDGRQTTLLLGMTRTVADLGFFSVGGGRISRGRWIAKITNLVNLSKFTNFRSGGINFTAKNWGGHPDPPSLL